MTKKFTKNNLRFRSDEAEPGKTFVENRNTGEIYAFLPEEFPLPIVNGEIDKDILHLRKNLFSALKK